MRPRTGRIRRPLKNREMKSVPIDKTKSEGVYLNKVVQRISYESISSEERRKEAKKPLYLVRYE